MNNSRLSIDELLDEQSQQVIRATIEKIEGDAEHVKVTPWTSNGGCNCDLAINVKKASIEGATPTGETHVCCGKTLKIVEVHFKSEATLTLDELFRQLSAPRHTHRSPGASARGSGRARQQVNEILRSHLVNLAGRRSAHRFPGAPNLRNDCYEKFFNQMDLCTYWDNFDDCVCIAKWGLDLCLSGPGEFPPLLCAF